MIKIFKYPLKKETGEKVEKILDENFGLGAGKDSRVVEESKNTHYSNPAEYILCFDGEKLIGIQNIFLREVKFENQKILIGGLGGLCVDKDYRGHGIAKELLQNGIGELKKLNCDIGMLFTDIHNPKFQKLYGQFGFVVLERDYTFLDKLNNMHTDNYAMIAPANSEEKFNLVLYSQEILHLGAGEW